MKKTYRWGILGAGNIAEKFASALDYTDGAEVFAVASRDMDKASAFGKKHGATHIYNEYLQLALDKDVDVIYIATPHAFHCDQTISCLEHNKPVVCEKPMALSHGQVTKMIDAARTHRSFLMEGMWSRFMPATLKVLEVIAGDVIGPVQYVRADFGFPAPFKPEGRLFNLQLGGGSLLDVGIYPLFLTSMLLGAPSLIKAMGKLSVTGADEYCNIQFQYPGGQTANIFSSITIKTSLTAEICGTKGRIYLHEPWYKAKAITVSGNDGSSNTYALPHEHNGFEYEIREVMRCLDEGLTECPLMPHELSLMMAETMDTIREQCGILYE